MVKKSLVRRCNPQSDHCQSRTLEDAFFALFFARLAAASFKSQMLQSKNISHSYFGLGKVNGRIINARFEDAVPLLLAAKIVSHSRPARPWR